MLQSIYQQIWKTQQWPQDWKRSVFTPNPKKGNAQECSNYCTIAFISHTSKVMLKIPQVRLQQYMNHELPDTQAGFRQSREKPEIKLPTSTESSKKQENSRKTSTSASLTMPKPLTVWNNNLWKILQEFWNSRLPDLLLRNMYPGQEETVKTRHGTTDWFQIRKGVHQGCILSPCVFNLYAEYIIWNARLDKHKLESRFLGEK